MGMGRIQIRAERMGIVFPSNLAPLSGVPLMVERFVQKAEDLRSVRIFAVCTCGGYECVNALPALSRLRKIIKACGGRLTDEYSVRLPMNNLDYDHIPVPIVRDQGLILDRGKRKIVEICGLIEKKKSTKHRTAKRLFQSLMTPFYLLMRKSVTDALKEKAKEPKNTKLRYWELIPLTDRSIALDEACSGCGTCAEVCPANNIKIIRGRPEFQHKCEMCFACDEFCPSNAIHHWSRMRGVKYHHPEANFSEMIIQR
jgi:ferredoxin